MRTHNIEVTSPTASTSILASSVETILIVALGFWLIWTGVIAIWGSPNTDFPNYYVMARLIREHYNLDRVYDWIWFQRAADRFGVRHQLVGYLGLTPFSAVPIIPFSALAVLPAKHLWTLCNVVLLAASVTLLGRAADLSMRRSWILSLLSGIALRNNLALGQMHLLVLLLLAAAYICHMRGRQVAAGSLLAIAGALKIYPLLFFLYFIVKRRWRTLAAMTVCGTLCLVLSLWITGWNLTSTYFMEQLPRTLQGESSNPFLASSTSASALFHRLFLYEPELSSRPLVYSPFLYATLYPLWQAVLLGSVIAHLKRDFSPGARETVEWCCFLSLLLFLSSAPSSYHFVALIAVAIPLVAALISIAQRTTAAIFTVLYIAACNFGTLTLHRPIVPIILPLLYLKLGAGIAILALCIFVLRHISERRFRLTRTWSPLRVSAALTLCLWIPAFYSTFSHIRRRYADRIQRLAFADNAYLRIQPERTQHGLLYVAMLPEGYRILSNGSPLLSSTNAASDEDQLSFSSDAAGDSVWVEVIAKGQPGIEQAISTTTSGPICRIPEAESPSLSTDGSVLAFIREDHGTGSLWVVSPAYCHNPLSVLQPQQITPSSWDVRTVGPGPANSFVFSLNAVDQLLFQVRPGNVFTPIVSTTGTVDYPAVAPNGRRLLYRQLINRRWQLVVRDIASGEGEQLTFSDCNAYTPHWQNDHTVLYATDCNRGLGQTTLAVLHMRD